LYSCWSNWMRLMSSLSSFTFLETVRQACCEYTTHIVLILLFISRRDVLVFEERCANIRREIGDYSRRCARITALNVLWCIIWK
jgi:hypothetical protein